MKNYTAWSKNNPNQPQSTARETYFQRTRSDQYFVPFCTTMPVFPGGNEIPQALSVEKNNCEGDSNKT